MRKPSTSVTTTTRTSTFPAVTAARPHAVSSVASSGSATGTESFTYDAAGNMTKRSTSTTAGKVYEWDREGRVKSVADLATASKKIEYLYDADGNRLIERDNTGTTATITLNVGASQIKVNDGTTPALNTSTTRTYTIGDEAVATHTASGVRLMATDDQGTPLVTVNPNNLTYVKRRLSPFGEQLQAPASPGWPSNKGFLNKTTDTWAGTSHLEAREYDARDGRFISVDPIADFSNPQQLNGYAYSNNSPVTYSDATGLYLACECGSIATAPSKGPGGKWRQPDVEAGLGRYETPSTRQQSGMAHKKYAAVRTYGAGSPQAKAATYDYNAFTRFSQRAYGAKTMTWGELGTSLRRAWFDDRECTGGASLGCGAAVAGILPLGKLARVLKEGVDASRAAKAGTGLRKVGGALESVDDVMANPALLKGRHPAQVENILKDTPGWHVETLGRGSQAGRGWVFRQYTPGGHPTGQQLRWHPGGGHHGPDPYWRVVGPNGGLGGIIQ